MFELTFHEEGRVARAQIAQDLLAEGQLNLCLVQLPAPSADVLSEDQGRPQAVAAVRDLVTGGPGHDGPVLQQTAPGNEAVLVVLPELAFGSSDWVALDAMVRASTRPLVLVGGFGFCAGQALLDWKGEEVAGETVRWTAWETPEDFSAVMRVNGGWCWVHAPGEATHCIAFLKWSQEQSVEAVEFADVQPGKAILHLRFGDLDLFPLICSDLLVPAAANADCPQARIQRAIADSPAPERKAMIVGSLLQLRFSNHWAVAIDSAANVTLAGRKAAIALSNSVIDAPVADEEIDRWRGLSGVLGRRGALPGGKQAHLPVARGLLNHNVAGAVVRSTDARATVGSIHWGPYGVPHGAFLWKARMTCRVEEDGLAAPVIEPPAATELIRYIRRHPAAPGTASCLASGLAEVRDHVATRDEPSAATLLASILNGIEPRARVDPDDLHAPEVQTALTIGLHALAALKSMDAVDWQGRTGEEGQLTKPRPMNLLVWRSPVLDRLAMRRKLADWRRTPGDHPPLVVFGASPRLDLVLGEVEDDRRDDFTSAPGPGGTVAMGGSLGAIDDDITVARGRRRVAAIPLSAIAEIYCEADDGAEPAEARAAALIAQIDGLFEKAA